MGKRGAAAGASKSAAKAPKVEGPLDLVLGALKADAALSAAIPLALATPAAERQEFQETVLGAAAKALADGESAHRGALEEAERAVASIEADMTALEAALEAAKAGEAEKAALKDAKGADEGAASAGVQEKLAAVERAKQAAREVEEAQAAHRATLGEFEGAVAELWTPLKTAAFPGSQWRERFKLVNRLLTQLRAASTPESLVAAVEASLKTKAEARGSFAHKAVEHAEAAHSAHIALLRQKVDEHGAQVEGSTRAVDEASAAVQAAEAVRDAAVDASVVAQNAWVDATSATMSARSALSEFGVVVEGRTQALERTKADSAKTAEIIKAFEALRAGPEPKPEEEAAPEAAAPAAPAADSDGALPAAAAAEPVEVAPEDAS